MTEKVGFNVSVSKDTVARFRQYCDDKRLVQSFVIEACMEAFLDGTIELAMDPNMKLKVVPSQK